MPEDLGYNTDKRQRIIDKQGRPLRDHDNRSHGKVAFRGKDGKPNPRAQRLEARRKDFDDLREKGGRKRPGSLRK